MDQPVHQLCYYCNTVFNKCKLKFSQNVRFLCIELYHSCIKCIWKTSCQKVTNAAGKLHARNLNSVNLIKFYVSDCIIDVQTVSGNNHARFASKTVSFVSEKLLQFYT